MIAVLTLRGEEKHLNNNESLQIEHCVPLSKIPPNIIFDSFKKILYRSKKALNVGSNNGAGPSLDSPGENFILIISYKRNSIQKFISKIKAKYVKQ